MQQPRRRRVGVDTPAAAAQCARRIVGRRLRLQHRRIERDVEVIREHSRRHVRFAHRDGNGAWAARWILLDRQSNGDSVHAFRMSLQWIGN